MRVEGGKEAFRAGGCRTAVEAAAEGEVRKGRRGRAPPLLPFIVRRWPAELVAVAVVCGERMAACNGCNGRLTLCVGLREVEAAETDTEPATAVELSCAMTCEKARVAVQGSSVQR